MATRFYLPASGAAAVSPAFEVGWGNVPGTPVRRRCSSYPTGTTIASTTQASGLVSGKQNMVQFVSDPIRAQTVGSGTVKGVARCLESATNDNIMQFVLSVRVVSNDGSTFRGNVITLGQYGPSNEWATALTNRFLASVGTATTAVHALNGDRLVIEIGYLDAAGASISGSVSFGDSAAADCAENETATTANNAWIELSDTLVFKPGFVTSGATSTDTGATTIATPSFRVFAGMTLAVIVATDGAFATNSVTDTGSANTFTRRSTQSVSGGQIDIFIAKNTAAVTSDTITANLGGSCSFRRITVLQYLGLDMLGEPFDSQASATANSTTQSAGTLTTTIPDEVLVLGLSEFNAHTYTVAPFTQRAINAGTDFWVGDEIVTSQGSYPGTVTVSHNAGTGSDTYIAAMVMLRAENPSEMASFQQYAPPNVEGVRAAAY
jgi:hypothetical protein